MKHKFRVTRISRFGSSHTYRYLCLWEGNALFLNRIMRDVSIFVNVLLSDIANNFDIQQSKTVLLAQYCAGDKTKKNEMDGACSAYG